VDKLNLEEGDTVELIYAVPLSRLNVHSSFATKPAGIHGELRMEKKGGYVVEGVTVSVVGIPNPSNSQTRTMTSEGAEAAGGSSA
jgi:hypothetical protein